MCFLGLHRWSKWELVDDGNTYKNELIGKRYTGFYYVQERRCVNCNKISRKMKIMRC